MGGYSEWASVVRVLQYNKWDSYSFKVGTNIRVPSSTSQQQHKRATLHTLEYQNWLWYWRFKHPDLWELCVPYTGQSKTTAELKSGEVPFLLPICVYSIAIWKVDLERWGYNIL